MVLILRKDINWVSKANRWLFLDAIRGIAALAVVAQHVLWFLDPRFESFFSTIWSPGRFGVVAFFIVSGFIVPRSLEMKGDIKGFWISRFFRLYPSYWFSLLFIGLLPIVGIASHSPADLTSLKSWIANITMLQGFARIPDVNPVAWTLGLEMVLYLAITISFAKGFLKKTWFIALSLLCAIAAFSVLLPVVFHIRFPAGAAAVFGSIIGGLALFRWFSGELAKAQALTITGLCLVVTIASSVVNYSPVRLTSDALQPTQFCAIFSAISGYVFFLWFLKARNAKFPSWILWLGKVSYSLYLLHPIALALLPSTGNALLTGTLQIGLSLALAWFGYECIEVPSVEMAKRILAKRTAKTEIPIELAPEKAA